MAGAARAVARSCHVAPVAVGGTAPDDGAAPDDNVTVTNGQAGYSGTPMVRKLGVKAGQLVVLCGAPTGWTIPDPLDTKVAALHDGPVRHEHWTRAPSGK